MFEKCQCSSPGFCPIFNRAMGTNPPDWRWCQRTKPEERKKYYDILSKAPPPPKKKLADLLVEFKDDPQKLFLYYLTQYNRHHRCSLAATEQQKKNLKILNYFDHQSKLIDSFDNVEILCLGHSQKQFDTIPDRPYLKKVNLNQIDAGKYSDNKWAESRAFVPDLFSSNAEFVGFITASWNLKYEPFSFIENFHNWNYAKVLINSKPEDEIVVCADIFCTCFWLSKDTEGSILSHFFKDDSKVIGRKFLKLISLDRYKHVKVPFGNQMIMHKSLLKQYIDYLNDFNIFDKVDYFINNYAIRYIYNDDIVRDKYQYNRLHAYLMEMVSCFWFAKKDWLYLPVTQRRENWYSSQAIENRIKKW